MSFVSFGPFFLQGGVVPNHPTSRGRCRPSGAFDLARVRLSTDPVGNSSLLISGLPVGTDIFVLSAGTTTVMLQIDAHPATSYLYSYSTYSADTIVDLGFIQTGYVPHYVRGLTLPRANSVLPVALTLDRNFA